MSADPYQTLGVTKSATQDDIRKAYRKLAKELHPDLNPGDTQAEERFKQVSSAYAILGDAEQRARFDRGEIDASGAERPEQQFYRQYADAEGARRYTSSSGMEDFGEFSDLFTDLFGQRARGQQGFSGGPGSGGMKMRGADVRYHMEVSFMEAVNGGERRITLPEGSTLDLTIPSGTQDNAVLRLRGKGGEGFGGGPRGDALVEIKVLPHAVFRRDGNDIELEVPITLDEAVLGGKVEVPTVSGRVSVSIPKGASSGTVLRLKGKGVAPRGQEAGDQRVVLKIVMPETVDESLEQFITDWRKNKAYDPRAALRRAT